MQPYLHKNENGTEFQVWQFSKPSIEAKALFTLLGRNDNTEESLLELIRIAPQDQAVLRDCAAHCPRLVAHIERALQYRLRVEEEFRALCHGQDRGHCIVAREAPFSRRCWQTLAPSKWQR
jgi:hypothetical protein